MDKERPTDEWERVWFDAAQKPLTPQEEDATWRMARYTYVGRTTLDAREAADLAIAYLRLVEQRDALREQLRTSAAGELADLKRAIGLPSTAKICGKKSWAKDGAQCLEAVGHEADGTWHTAKGASWAPSHG